MEDETTIEQEPTRRVSSRALVVLLVILAITISTMFLSLLFGGAFANVDKLEGLP